MKKLDFELFDTVALQASESPRRRMHYDLRTEAFEPLRVDGSHSWHDTSMKMLNVLMADSVIPVHRHADTNEVVVVMRGSGIELTFGATADSSSASHENPPVLGTLSSLDTLSRDILGAFPVPEGLQITNCVHLAAGSPCPGVLVPRGAWHTFIALEDGTTIFEAKDGAYDPVGTEEIFGAR